MERNLWTTVARERRGEKKLPRHAIIPSRLGRKRWADPLRIIRRKKNVASSDPEWQRRAAALYHETEGNGAGNAVTDTGEKEQRGKGKGRSFFVLSLGRDGSTLGWVWVGVCSWIREKSSFIVAPITLEGRAFTDLTGGTNNYVILGRKENLEERKCREACSECKASPRGGGEMVQRAR